MRINLSEKWKGRLKSYGPLAIWIGLILLLSSNQGSMAQTSLFIGPILKLLFPNASEATIQIYHGYVRKCAHFTEYAILSFLAWRAFATTSSALAGRFAFTFALSLVVLTALADELNQSYVPSRTGSIYDSAIDVAGGAAMLVIVWIVRHRRRRTIYQW